MRWKSVVLKNGHQNLPFLSLSSTTTPLHKPNRIEPARGNWIRVFQIAWIMLVMFAMLTEAEEPLIRRLVIVSRHASVSLHGLSSVELVSSEHKQKHTLLAKKTARSKRETKRAFRERFHNHSCAH